jgi:hypothetical protein
MVKKLSVRRIKQRERFARGPGSALMFTRSAMAGAALLLWGLVTVFGTYGCQSAPSPIIVGDTYTNIEYEYSLRIPKGWEPRKELPAEFSYFNRLANPDMCSLMLYNEKSGGLIAIMNNVNRIDYDQYFDISYAKWDEIVSSLKSSLDEELPVVAFKHSIDMENLYMTQQNYFANQFAYKPEKVYGVETRFEIKDGTIHLNFDAFLFPCRNTKSCETLIILTCKDEDLLENQPAFEIVLSSLRAHDYYE